MARLSQPFLLKRGAHASSRAAIDFMPNGYRGSSGSSPLHSSDSKDRVVLKIRKKIYGVESAVVGVILLVVRRFGLLPNASTIPLDWILNFAHT